MNSGDLGGVPGEAGWLYLKEKEPNTLQWQYTVDSQTINLKAFKRKGDRQIGKNWYIIKIKHKYYKRHGNTSMVKQ